MTIIGLSGYAGSGKDTVGQILVEHHGFRRIAFADRLKALALDLDPALLIETVCASPEVAPGVETYARRESLSQIVECYGSLDVAKREVPAVREYLQHLGVKVRKHLGEDTWIRAALAGTAGEDVVVTDVRFRNEADAIREGKGLILRVTRPDYGPVNGHVSEHDLDAYGFDDVIRNEGTVTDLEVSVARTLGYRGVVC